MKSIIFYCDITGTYIDKDVDINYLMTIEKSLFLNEQLDSSLANRRLILAYYKSRMSKVRNLVENLFHLMTQEDANRLYFSFVSSHDVDVVGMCIQELSVAVDQLGLSEVIKIGTCFAGDRKIRLPNGDWHKGTQIVDEESKSGVKISQIWNNAHKMKELMNNYNQQNQQKQTTGLGRIFYADDEQFYHDFLKIVQEGSDLDIVHFMPSGLNNLNQSISSYIDDNQNINNDVLGG